MDYIEIVIAVVILGVLVGGGAALMHAGDAKKDFMAECQKDHKKYECTAMWRQGNQDVVPVFIPVGR